jgi:hypothetical protein
VTNITSTSIAQSIFVAQPATGNSGSVYPADSGGPGLLGGPTPPYIMQYYRLRFPYAWSWP